MSIPISLSESDFQKNVEPFLSKARRGYVCRIPLYKVFNYILYRLYSGCQWKALPIDKREDGSGKKELSYQSVAHHFRKWCKDGSLKAVYKHSILTIFDDLDLSEIILDGTHTIAKKGGKSVKYQPRRKAKTSNILPLIEKKGYIIATTPIIAGNHHDSYQLSENLKLLFKMLKELSLPFEGAYLSMDSAFDSKESRKICFNYQVIPNVKDNPRNRKQPKKGRKRLFSEQVYKQRFTCEQVFAWIDKFKALLIRFERKDEYFFGLNLIAFSMINLRNVVTKV